MGQAPPYATEGLPRRRERSDLAQLEVKVPVDHRLRLGLLLLLLRLRPRPPLRPRLVATLVPRGLARSPVLNALAADECAGQRLARAVNVRGELALERRR